MTDNTIINSGVKGFSYCCPGCGSVFYRDEALYNVSPLILPTYTTDHTHDSPNNAAIPIYVELDTLKLWESKGNSLTLSSDEVLAILREKNNVKNWAPVPKSIQDLKGFNFKIGTEDSYVEISDKFKSVGSNDQIPYRFVVILDNWETTGYEFLRYDWKTDYDMFDELDVEPNSVTPSAFHCPHCRAAVLRHAFACEQKLIGLFGDPDVGKSCLILALSSELQRQAEVQMDRQKISRPLNFLRESDILKRAGVTESVSVKMSSDPDQEVTWEEALDEMKKILEKQYSKDEVTKEFVVRNMYEQGYIVEKTSTIEKNVFDTSLYVENEELGLIKTILTFVDIAGDVFVSKDAGFNRTAIGQNFPVFKHCDLFIFCVEKKKTVEQRRLMGNMQNSIVQFMEYLNDRSEKKDLNRLAMMFLVTKCDEWYDTSEKSNLNEMPFEDEQNNKYGRLSDLFGFYNAYDILTQELKCGPLLGLLSDYSKLTPLYCTAYGKEPRHYNNFMNDSKEWDEIPSIKVNPINIDLILKWVCFVLGRSKYGDGIKRNPKNPISLDELQNYKIDFNKLRCETEQLEVKDLIVLGELFCNLTREERQFYKKLLFLKNCQCVYDKKIAEINQEISQYNIDLKSAIDKIDEEFNAIASTERNKFELLTQKKQTEKDNKTDMFGKEFQSVKEKFQNLISNKNEELQLHHDKLPSTIDNFYKDTSKGMSDLEKKLLRQRDEKIEAIYKMENEEKNNTAFLSRKFLHKKNRELDYEQQRIDYEKEWIKASQLAKQEYESHREEELKRLKFTHDEIVINIKKDIDSYDAEMNKELSQLTDEKSKILRELEDDIVNAKKELENLLCDNSSYCNEEKLKIEKEFEPLIQNCKTRIESIEEERISEIRRLGLENELLGGN